MIPVATQRPNAYGLFGLYGNAYEWCQDDAQYFETDKEFLPDFEQLANPEVVDTRGRVLRGGSFDNNATNIRSALRINNRPVSRNVFYGFRVSRTLSAGRQVGLARIRLHQRNAGTNAPVE
jgi:formylglycine-generating enzyme required for sulfatase activity